MASSVSSVWTTDQMESSSCFNTGKHHYYVYNFSHSIVQSIYRINDHTDVTYVVSTEAGGGLITSRCYCHNFIIVMYIHVIVIGILWLYDIGSIRMVYIILWERPLHMTLYLLKAERSGWSHLSIVALIKIIVYLEEKMVQVVIN